MPCQASAFALLPLPGDLNLMGIYIPSWLLMGFLGFATSLLIVQVMEKLGWTRFVWHLPLFFLSLSVFFSCLYAVLLLSS